MDKDSFDALVAEIGFSPVPEKFRGLIKNVALLIEDDVPILTREEMDLPDNETLLGLYHGLPLSVRGDNYGVGGALPDTITLYRLPIVNAAREDGISVRQMIEETIWHEVAHHFGLDEEAVRRREDERSKEA